MFLFNRGVPNQCQTLFAFVVRKKNNNELKLTGTGVLPVVSKQAQHWTLGHAFRYKTNHLPLASPILSLLTTSHATGSYRKISNIRRTKSKNLNVSRLFLQLYLCNILKPVVKSRMKIVGAAPTGDAPISSEWSTISLPTKVWLILETWRVCWKRL